MEMFYVSLDTVVNFVLYIHFEVEVHEVAVFIEKLAVTRTFPVLYYWSHSVCEHLSIVQLSWP